MSSKWVTTAAEIVEESEERPHASMPHEWMVESSVLQFSHRCTIHILLLIKLSPCKFKCLSATKIVKIQYFLDSRSNIANID